MTAHLKQYLDYYKSCENPGYAILVTGDWGVGKTYQVKAALSEDERYYVSLFGLASADEIYSAVYAAQHPALSRVKDATSAAEGASLNLGVGEIPLGKWVSGLANAILRQDAETDRTIIFDDLERCSVAVEEILGVINQYVEHHQCRVIVIAHDEKLTEKFDNTKEKLFGQTLRVEPLLDDAFDSFSAQLRQRFPRIVELGFLEQHRSEIVGIFQTSQVKSLRILRHLIEDIARFHDVLFDKHLENANAMAEALRVFSAMNVEVRAGRLKSDDLVDRGGAVLGYQVRQASKKNSQDDLVPPIARAANRYPAIDLTSTIFSDAVLKQMLIHGNYDREQIQRSIDGSAYFLVPAETPAWKVFLNFREISDVVADDAITRMKQQFAARDVTERGDLLHLFSLRFMMVENRLLGGTVKQVAKECRRYIYDLRKSGSLPSKDFRERRFYDDAHDGYVFWVTDGYRKEFIEVVKYLDESSARVLESTFPALAKELLELLRDEGEEFFNRLCASHKGAGVYSSLPILSYTKPADFVAALEAAAPNSWYFVEAVFKERYSGGRLEPERDLVKERVWLLRVAKLLATRKARSKGIRVLRIEQVLRRISCFVVE